MRILVVTSQYPLSGDPQRGRAVSQTVSRLGRISDVSVLSPVATYPPGLHPRSYTYHAASETSTAEIPAKYVTFPVLPGVSRPLNGWLCARALARPIENARPDVILSYWLYPDAYGAMAVARRLKIPMVAGARGSDLRARDWLSRRMARTVVRGADRVLVVSRDLGRIAVERDGARADRVRVIPNGCDSRTFRLQDRQTVRRNLGVPADARLLLYVGRLVPEKGLRELVESMAILRQSGRPAMLSVVGDGPMRAELEEAARAAPGDMVLTGALDPPSVADWMAAADAVVLPSYSEGYPNVLVEALACGRPIVATPVGGIMEIADGACAIQVPPRDAQGLARGLLEAFDRDWNEVELSQRHSRSWEDVARQTLAACVEAVEIPRAGT